jgi:hypothetical protein
MVGWKEKVWTGHIELKKNIRNISCRVSPFEKELHPVTSQ